MKEAREKEEYRRGKGEGKEERLGLKNKQAFSQLEEKLFITEPKDWYLVPKSHVNLINSRFLKEYRSLPFLPPL